MSVTTPSPNEAASLGAGVSAPHSFVKDAVRAAATVDRDSVPGHSGLNRDNVEQAPKLDMRHEFRKPLFSFLKPLRFGLVYRSLARPSC